MDKMASNWEDKEDEREDGESIGQPGRAKEEIYLGRSTDPGT